MGSDNVYDVRRHDHDLEDPWRVPAGVKTVSLVLAENGKPCRLQTEFSAYHDGVSLFVIFRCADDHVVASMLEHDAPLWEEDVVEVFLAPAGLTRYFEIEVNPLGTTFDAIIDSPTGQRDAMQVDASWTCAGLRASIRRVTEEGIVFVSTMLAVPFASLDSAGPRPGETWRANFFRVDRSPAGDEFTAWCPTGRTPPDFHVPSRFGVLRFS
jgi:hypothetical protein